MSLQTSGRVLDKDDAEKQLHVSRRGPEAVALALELWGDPRGEVVLDVRGLGQLYELLGHLVLGLGAEVARTERGAS